MDEEARYDLTELSNRAGVSPRTVRYYIQLGLLPSPGSGPGVRYGRGHLDRLRLIRLLQSQHLPLHEISARLASLDDDQVSAAVDDATQAQSQSRKTNTAAEYIRAVFARQSTSLSVLPPGTARVPSGKSSEPGPATSYVRRENWERIQLTDDVELNVRRPLSREMNRRIERLLAVARQILTDQSTGGEEK